MTNRALVKAASLGERALWCPSSALRAPSPRVRGEGRSRRLLFYQRQPTTALAR